MAAAIDPVRVVRRLGAEVGRLRFKPPTAYVYNPLDYAWDPHREYLERYGRGAREALLVGMNPGPWGMAQTGVPFGEVTAVREWLGLTRRARRPEREHPKRPILGLDCPRSEVSGLRFWGFLRETFKRPEAFFARMFVLNYCPLMFLEAGGKNRTPDQLPAAEREPLIAACDEALRDFVRYYRPRVVIGVGGFAQTRAREALEGTDVAVDVMLHPSPANPMANRGWSGPAATALRRHGLLA